MLVGPNRPYTLSDINWSALEPPIGIEACPLSEVLLPRPSTQLRRRESYRVSGFRWGCLRKENSISDSHLIARLTTAVSSKPSNSRSFDQRRRP